jgi:transcription initiation factor TFIIE subunit beta
MNSELLREREAFKKRAMATAAVSAPSKRPKESSGPSAAPEASRKSSKSGEQSAKAKLDLAQMKSMGQSGSQFKFGVLAKIVRHMKARHMEGEDQPLTMEDILDETNQVSGVCLRHNLFVLEFEKNGLFIDCLSISQ